MQNQSCTVNGRRFILQALLGKGKGGYSYLASDGEKSYVLKQIHHEPCDYYQFGDKMQAELHDYRQLRALGIRMPELIDADLEHERILKEYIRGETIFQLVLQDKFRPEYLEQMQAMCRLLYPANLNIDYFPTNFVVQDDLLYYVDYECNSYIPQWNFENWGVQYWSKTPAFLQYAQSTAGKK